MLNILHIVPDDKFINDAKIVMDSVPNTSNRYVCPVTDERHYQAQYIDKYDFVDIVSYQTLEELLQNEDTDIIAFHTIPFDRYKWILIIPPRIKVWWLVWGYDIYINTSGRDIEPIIPLMLYKPLTYSYVRSQFPPTPTIYENIKKKIKILVNYNGNRDREIKRLKEIRVVKNLRQKVLRRIDYISTVLPIEYDMLLKIKGVHAKYVPFRYACITSDTPTSISPEASYILLGNSSDSSNNHLDVLNIIKKRNISNKVYIPLGYGDTDYKKYIKERIDDSDNIIIQDDFVSRDEYVMNLSKCKVAILGHIRQQALGNIAMAMMLGMKIFLYKDSMCYKYLRQSGFVVYSIEKDLNRASVDEPISQNDEEINRFKIEELLSYSSVQTAVQNFFYNEEFAIKSGCNI